MKIFSSQKEYGFTLAEMMVAIGIFTAFSVYAIGAALIVVDKHNREQDMRSSMDSLNFIMEDMSRNLRLGTNFHCFAAGETGTGIDGTGAVTPQNCSSGSNKIVFIGVTGTPITYIFTSPSSGAVTIQKIFGTGSPQVLSVPYVTIDYTKSGFVVDGAPQGDGLQPVVNIGIAGTVTTKGVTSNFSIQTTVASRPLDG